ncbi:GNAT family N-acetyltransferase [Exiguobacterium sp. OS-77]|uniref:GNAT family N-acetyltransferase n=1 Tax=Exiguobacterium sp. OS-77 TaxID=1241306 RepID=UPI0005584E27|nr:GNAT family N-acetyltransferase [Exiguobacterium sp. OS-77]
MKINSISIRKMQHTDYEIISQWLSTKEVLEFYGDMNAPFTLQQVIDKYEPRVNGEIPVAPYIVELEDEPIGFMQRYLITDEQKEAFGYPANFIIIGMDQFIGYPELFNKGIGTKMIKLFVEDIARGKEVNRIILDPDVSNLRAIKAYEKCGFQKVKKINEDTCWMMEYTIDHP